METDFKKSVFDRELFQFSLELLTFMEKLSGTTAAGQLNSTLVRKTLVEAFTTNDSLAELHIFLRTINQLDFKDFQKNLPAFFENASFIKRYGQLLFDDYLMTLRHLGDSDNFNNWDEFSKSLRSISALSPVVIEEFLLTVRHLAIESNHFTSWVGFFKSTVAASSKPDLIISYFTTLRHALNYFKKSETFESMMKVLTEQSSLSAFDAYSYGQLESKKWLIEETLKSRGDSWGTVFILAGWIGSLAQLIFDSGEIKIDKIRSFDIDSPSCKLAEKLNNPQVLDQWKFKAVNMDISMMKYPTEYFVKRHDGSACELYDQPSLIINTSCEHIENLSAWWNNIPPGAAVVLQNNNAFHISDHINCVKSLEEFKKQLPLTKIDFSGELPLADYTRYMLIGEK